jgi:hypothetical protein
MLYAATPARDAGVSPNVDAFVSQGASTFTEAHTDLGELRETIDDPDGGSQTCYGGTNDDAYFDLLEFRCDQYYCGNEPVLMPWLAEEALPCYTALGNACGTQLDEGGFFYRSESGLFQLELAFDPQLGQMGFSDEAFTTHFVALSITGMLMQETYHPVTRNGDDGLWIRFDRRWEAQELIDAGYHFENGRLIGEISGILDTVYYDWAESSDSACTADDIIFDCKCRIEGIATPYTLGLRAQLGAVGG